MALLKSIESVVTSADGSAVNDPLVDSQARCLTILYLCARYLRDMEPLAANPGDPRIQVLTNLLAINLIRITQANAAQLRCDYELVAGLLGIELCGAVSGRDGQVH